MSSNWDVLTRSSRTWTSKRKTKAQDLEITFDDTARAEYLTGFHKRNVERRNKRVAHAKAMERKERNQQRTEKRRAFVELARQMEGERNAPENPSLSDDEHDEQANEGESQQQRKPKKEIASFANDELETTVTVTEMSLGNDLPLTAILEEARAKLQESLEDEENDDKSDGDEDATVSGFAAPKSDDAAAHKKKHKKVFKYESKKERKEERKKQLTGSKTLNKKAVKKGAKPKKGETKRSARKGGAGAAS
ncbi:rRNA binding [Blastocladiella emersonii ATCC 22665]|nr:rRNA binding [Blastocladiella emersonii ATCC 22665]